MIDIEERIYNLESTYAHLEDEINKLPTYFEKGEVVNGIFDDIRSLRNRINVLRNTLALIRSRLTTKD